MSSRIDEETMLPLRVVAIFLVAVISATVTGVFWVSKVDDRLARIEEKLGISSYDAKAGIINSANAGDGK